MVVFSELNAALELLKKAANAISKMGNIDPQIVRDLEELRRLVVSGIGREGELMLQIQKLEERLLPQTLSYDDDSGAYFSPSDTEKKQPYCTQCLEAHRLPLTLQVTDEYSQCSSCKTKYQSRVQKSAEQLRHSQLQRFADGVPKSPFED